MVVPAGEPDQATLIANLDANVGYGYYRCRTRDERSGLMIR